MSLFNGGIYYLIDNVNFSFIGDHFADLAFFRFIIPDTIHINKAAAITQTKYLY